MSFSISIIKNPIFVRDERRKCHVINWDESSGDHNLNTDLDYEYFYEIPKFLDINLTRSPRNEGEKLSETQERFKNDYIKFAKEKGYKMLGRFWYEFDDVIYFPSEINELREECLRAKSKSKNLQLITSVDKILEACDNALKTDSGLYFGCD